MPEIHVHLHGRRKTRDARDADYSKMSNGELIELRAKALTRGSSDPVAEAIKKELDRRKASTTATFKR
jgi:hypothetical protein